MSSFFLFGKSSSKSTYGPTKSATIGKSPFARVDTLDFQLQPHIVALHEGEEVV